MKFKSPVYSQVSGSIAGLTYAHNAGGLYARGRSIPSNPNSVKQQRVRAAMGSMVAYWYATLTASQRTAWNDYAANTPVTDKLGSSILLSGQNMFVRYNVAALNLLNSGLAASSALAGVQADAPLENNTGVPVATIIAANRATGPALTINGTFDTPQPDAAALIIQRSGRLSPGINFFNGPWTLAAAAVVAISASTWTTGALDLTDASQWLGPSDLVEGDIMAFRLRVLTQDGRLSQEFKQIITLT